MPSAATGSKLKQATLGTNSLQTQNTHWQTPHPQLWMRKWGCRQAGRPARGSIRWQLLWKTSTERNQYLGMQISLPKNSQNIHCSWEWLPAASLFLHSKVVHVCGQHHNTNVNSLAMTYTQDHTRTGLCPPSLSHICSSHSTCLQSCPSKPSSWLALALTTGILQLIHTASSHTPN